MERLHGLDSRIMTMLRDTTENLKTDIRYKYVLGSALISGCMSYLYLMTNTIHNHDNLYNTPRGSGAGTTSGRWMLQIMDILQHKFVGGWLNTPVMNTGVALVFLMLTCLLLVSVLELKSKWMCAAITAVTISFPAVAVAMVFNFTAHHYCFAILLTVLGVYFGKKNRIWNFFAGALILAASIGIYQAYFAYAAVLLLCLLIIECMKDAADWQKVITDSIKYGALLVVSFLIYRLILEYSLRINNVELDSYQGINEMGKIGLTNLSEIIKTIYANLLAILKGEYLSISNSNAVQVAVLVLYIYTLCGLIGWIIENKKLIKGFLLAGLVIIFPIAADAIELMAPNANKYSLMGFGLVGIFYLPVIIAEHSKIKNKVVQHGGVFLVSVLVFMAGFGYAYTTNVNCMSLHYKLEAAKSYYAILYSRIISQPGYTRDKEIAFISNDFESEHYDKWDIGDKMYSGAEFGFNYYDYSRKPFVELYLGTDYRYLSEEEREKYNTIIDSMDIYPSYSSIQVVDNLILVKTGD